MSSNLQMPPAVNAREILETMSFIRAAYLNRALLQLEDGYLKEARQSLETMEQHLERFMEDLRFIIERQPRISLERTKEREDKE